MFQYRHVSMRALRGALLSSFLLASGASASETSSEVLHWGYAHTAGPTHWSELAGNAACKAGLQQSPIALQSANVAHQHVASPGFHYLTSVVRMRNTGHTVEFAYDVGSTVQLGHNTYTLKQFHFHTPSEHAVDGVNYPMELHLVHTDASGNPALVVGVFIRTGAVNNALLSAFQHLPKHEGEVSAPTGAVINASALLPANRDFFSYPGSLTTPPCTEGIQWYVMKDPIELSDAQIAEYQRLAHFNPSNRPLQPLNGRNAALHPIHTH